MFEDGLLSPRARASTFEERGYAKTTHTLPESGSPFEIDSLNLPLRP